MILFIQIPCLNEANTLPIVVGAIPKKIPGIDNIEVLVIDDGSDDRTAELAQELRVQHIIRNKTTQGLGASFRIGMEYAYGEGADILINTDGDNQYPSDQIGLLVQTMIDQKADLVIGNRQTKHIAHFSPIKKVLQYLGTRFTSLLLGMPEIKDAVSGFRAYSRKAMEEINVTSQYSYVLDTSVQAAHKGLKIVSVDIRTNPPTRPSRLFKNNFQHVRKSLMDIIRTYAMYRPMRVFFWIGLFFFILGGIPLFRFLYDYLFGFGGQGKIQSLIIGSMLVMLSCTMFALGIIGDLLAKNRMLIERLLKEKK